MVNSTRQVCLELVSAPQRVVLGAVITGFLSGGKNTGEPILNNHCGLKIANIINEFGDIDTV